MHLTPNPPNHSSGSNRQRTPPSGRKGDGAKGSEGDG
ncbi:hypothetical protein CGRA01v4_07432 [Colletotrichum graminicola]|nr:hypothetical protein CGRA01v4_07432 [Colletotrichum graminicola]